MERGSGRHCVGSEEGGERPCFGLISFFHVIYGFFLVMAILFSCDICWFWSCWREGLHICRVFLSVPYFLGIIYSKFRSFGDTKKVWILMLSII